MKSCDPYLSGDRVIGEEDCLDDGAARIPAGADATRHDTQAASRNVRNDAEGRPGSKLHSILSTVLVWGEGSGSGFQQDTQPEINGTMLEVYAEVHCKPQRVTSLSLSQGFQLEYESNVSADYSLYEKGRRSIQACHLFQVRR